jgi:hypothetical protein
MSSQDILLLTPGRPALYTTTRALFPVLLPTFPTTGDVCKEFKKTGQFVTRNYEPMNYELNYEYYDL